MKAKFAAVALTSGLAVGRGIDCNAINGKTPITKLGICVK